jgi:hypothetical protein
MNSLPKDPVILLSYVNTMLRDKYSNLDDLCKSLNISADTITKPLSAIDYHYNKSLNRFS